MHVHAAKWLPFGAGALMLGSLAISAAPVTWHLRGTVAGSNNATLPEPAVSDSAPRPSADIASVLSLAPFGRPDAPPSAEEVAPMMLDMALLGIIRRDNPAESMALIDTGGRQANYKQGNKIGEAAILDQVNADHVVLLVDGARRILGFPNSDTVLDAPDAAGTSSGDSMASLLAAALAAPATQAYAEPATAPAPVTTQDYIDLWRERIRANPMQVLDEIGLVAGDGGYTIAENHDSGVSRAGLKAGDLVKSVNGRPVGNIDSDRALYDEVANSGLARVEIERDGRSILLSFPLQ